MIQPFFITLLLCCLSSLVYSADGPGDVTRSSISYGMPHRLATLQNSQITESSGIAASRRKQGVFWTHNDSGDSARVFAFDEQGRDLATVRVDGADAQDWEDMASFSRDGKHFLILADIGDNLTRRNDCRLYLIEEPNLQDEAVRPVQTIRFRYADGAHNCESVAVDPTKNLILLATKLLGPGSNVYELSVPATQSPDVLTAKRIATIAVPISTAMDISSDGRHAVVLTYGNAYEFARSKDESWTEAFSRPGREIVMPSRVQGESICYGHDGRSLYLTSEKLPTPLFVIPALDEPAK